MHESANKYVKEADKLKYFDNALKNKSKETPRIISSTSILSSKENQMNPSISKTSSLSSSNKNFFYLKNGLKRQHSNHTNNKFPESLNQTLISMKEQGMSAKKTSQKSFYFDSKRDLNSFFKKESNNMDTSENLNQSNYSTSQNHVNKSINSKKRFILPTSPIIQTERGMEVNSKHLEGRSSKKEVSSFELKIEPGRKELKNHSFSKFLEENPFKKSFQKQPQNKKKLGNKKININIKTINLIPKDLNSKALPSVKESYFKEKNTSKKLENFRKYNEKKEKTGATTKKNFKFFEARRKYLKQKNILKKQIKDYKEENKEIEENNQMDLQIFESDLKRFNAIKKENLILKSLYEINKIFNVKFDSSSFDCFRNYPEIVISKADFKVFHEKLLGKGGFAEVYAGIYQRKSVAVKIITISNEFIKHLLNEILTMLVCSQENLVRLYAISIEDNKPNEMSVYLLMELMKKDLKQIIFVEKKKLSKPLKYEILCDILKGLSHLHQSNYVHCDLKMQNILLDENNKAKISDFGLAKTLRSGSTKKSLIYGYSERSSSYEYLVEERISTKGDIWSFGILAYELLKEKISWDKLTGVQAVAKVSMKIPFFSLNEKLEDNFENQLIENCLNYNYVQRPSAKELLEILNHKKKTLF